MTLFSVQLTLEADLDEHRIGLLSDALEDVTLSSSALKKAESWCFEWITQTQPDLPDFISRMNSVFSMFALPDIQEKNLSVTALDETINWLERSYQGFQPFSVDRFFIYGSHYEGHIPEGQIPLKIDAATAFGSGTHGTTRGCLNAIQFLLEAGLQPDRILDMGAGSGILAIAASKLWPQSIILAADIDPESVRMTRHHAGLNKVVTPDPKFNVIESDGFQAQEIHDVEKFDIIIANMLAGPLKTMACDMKQHLEIDGYLVLSGILNEQAASVLGVYGDQDFHLKHVVEDDGWSTLVMQQGDAISS